MDCKDENDCEKTVRGNKNNNFDKEKTKVAHIIARNAWASKNMHVLSLSLLNEQWDHYYQI